MVGGQDVLSRSSKSEHKSVKLAGMVRSRHEKQGNGRRLFLFGGRLGTFILHFRPTRPVRYRVIGRVA